MQKRSHTLLASALLRSQEGFDARRFELAFLFGSFQPDCNPFSYLKGSLRARKFGGHNYTNSHDYIIAHIERLQRRRTAWTMWQYYTLGKLIHYTTDAFTYAHNDTFPVQLKQHKEYEDALQEHFLRFMERNPQVEIPSAHTIMEAISSYHEEYERVESNIHTDSRFALNACCCVLAILCLKPIV